MYRQVLIRTLATAALFVAALPDVAYADTSRSAGAREITRRGSAFLTSLSPAHVERALFPLDAPERVDWHFTPRRRPGVSLDQLDERQRRLGWSLMAAALSEVGYDKARSVILLEEILGEITGRPEYRDPENYAFVFFGTPSGTAPWAWRFEGHHLSLSFTIFPDDVVFTPAFFGTNPAVVPASHPRGGWRLLDEEHRLAFELLGSLNAEQRGRAIISSTTPGDIVAGPGRERSLREPQGIALADLTGAQRGLALRLIATYVNNIGDEFASRQIAEMEAAGVERIHFAWAGSTRPGASHYYRFHGPTLIIEYDATQSSGNHVHSVWHDPRHALDDVLHRHHSEADHR